MARILILSEVKQRELFAHALLKVILNKMGHEVKIIPTHFQPSKHIDYFKPELIVNNGLRKTRDFYRFIDYPKNKFGTVICTLYAEQVFSGSVDHFTYSNPLVLEGTDFHFAWGESFAKLLVNHSSISPSKIIVTGSHRLDLPLLRISSERMRLGKMANLNLQIPWVLVVDNIIVRNGAPAKKKLIDLKKRFDSTIRDVALNFKEVGFIYRPHPATPVHQVKMTNEYFQDLNNVVVYGQEPAFLWLREVEGVITWQSTTAIEAWASGIPVISIESNSIAKGDELHFWVNPHLTKPNSLPDILKFVQQFLDGNFLEEQDILDGRKQFIEKWYFKLDGLSTLRLAKAIHTILTAQITHDSVGAVSGKTICLRELLKVLEFYKGIVDARRDSYHISEREIKDAEKMICSLNQEKDVGQMVKSQFGWVFK